MFLDDKVKVFETILLKSFLSTNLPQIAHKFL